MMIGIRPVRAMRHLAAVIAIAILPSLAPQEAEAALSLSLNPSSIVASPGDTGTFDVVITNDGVGSPAVTINAFSLELGLPADGAAVFTAAERPSVGYLFDPAPGGDFTFDAFPTTGFVVSDPGDLSLPSRTLDAGESAILARVTYAVATNAPGGRLTIAFLAGTSFTASAVDPGTGFQVDTALDFTATDGEIVVRVAGIGVPEPSTAALALCGVGLLLVRRRPAR